MGNLPNKFKTIMSRISTQAMILTSASTLTGSIDMHGMTLSSVCSLSVFPTPLLQFNLHLPSFTSQALHENKYLAIHLLPPTHKSVHLSRIFASGIKKNKRLDTSPQELKDGEVFHEMTTPFSTLDKNTDWKLHSVSKDVNVPILCDSERILICETFKHMAVDDHEIWAVKVLEVLENPKYGDETLTGGLIYFNRGFHKIGKILSE